MPPVRTHRNKKRPPPTGYSSIEDTLLSYDNQMRDALTTTPTNQPKHQSQWPIFSITHRKSRYIYDLYYTREAISKELYDWLLKTGQADANLIAKWKKQGYEKLCCLRCVQTKETNFGGSCICRVPKASLRRADEDAGAGAGAEDGEGANKAVATTTTTASGGAGGGGIQCVNCGCRGCASSD